MAQGNEIGYAPLIRLQHHADRIWPVVRRLPFSMGRSRTLVAQCFAHRRQLNLRAMCLEGWDLEINGLPRLWRRERGCVFHGGASLRGLQDRPRPRINWLPVIKK